MEAILKNLQSLKVAVIGDVMLDHYIWGDASRISPEAPVPVIDVMRDTYVPGGAANVALNIQSLGAHVSLIGRTMNDDAGAQLMGLLNKEGVNFDPRFAQGEAPTIVKTRVIVRNQQMCRVDRESAPVEYAIDDDDEIWVVIEERLKRVDAIIFSDYAKGVITEGLVNRIKAFARRHDIFLAIDPKPRRPVNFEDLDLLTPNRTEALQMAKIELDPHEKFPAEEVCKRLWERFRCKNLVVTLGSDGLMISHNGERPKFMKTLAREVYDVSGAGDTVVAALTLALASGAHFEDAAQFANVAAGVVVSKLGTAKVTPEEVLAYEPDSATFTA